MCEGMVLVSEVCVWGLVMEDIPLLIEELSCKLLSSHMHETCCTNQLIPLLTGQHTICRNNTQTLEMQNQLWPHPLTFEPFGVDLFDEVGVDVS